MRKSYIIEFTQCNSVNEFVKYWRQFYVSSERESSIEKIYKDNIDWKDFNSIQKLYLWKNGGVEYSKHIYKSEFLKMIEDLLPEIEMARNNQKFDAIGFTKRLVLERHKGVIWTIFLLHIIKAVKFPIFDQHVYRSYAAINKFNPREIYNLKPIDIINIYFEEYIPFFENLSVKSSFSKKEIDEALVGFGRFLKTPWAQLIESI